MKSVRGVLEWAAARLAPFVVRRPYLTAVLVVLYLISPFDLLPEALLGPLGFLDDLVVLLLPLVLREYSRTLDVRNKPSKKDSYDTTAR